MLLIWLREEGLRQAGLLRARRVMHVLFFFLPPRTHLQVETST